MLWGDISSVRPGPSVLTRPDHGAKPRSLAERTYSDSRSPYLSTVNAIEDLQHHKVPNALFNVFNNLEPGADRVGNRSYRYESIARKVVNPFPLVIRPKPETRQRHAPTQVVTLP